MYNFVKNIVYTNLIQTVHLFAEATQRSHLFDCVNHKHWFAAAKTC